MVTCRSKDKKLYDNKLRKDDYFEYFREQFDT